MDIAKKDVSNVGTILFPRLVQARQVRTILSIELEYYNTKETPHSHVRQDIHRRLVHDVLALCTK